MDILVIFTIASLMIALTSLLSYEVLRIVWSAMPKMTIEPRLRVFFLLLPIFVVHIVSIWLYAFVYFILIRYFEGVGELVGAVSPIPAGKAFFIDCLYFSTTTYTTLGYGDVLPSGNLRLLAGAEVLNGFILLGWTVSFTYLAMEKFWQLPHKK